MNICLLSRDSRFNTNTTFEILQQKGRKSVIIQNTYQMVSSLLLELQPTWRDEISLYLHFFGRESEEDGLTAKQSLKWRKDGRERHLVFQKLSADIFKISAKIDTPFIIRSVLADILNGGKMKQKQSFSVLEAIS